MSRNTRSDANAQTDGSDAAPAATTDGCGCGDDATVAPEPFTELSGFKRDLLLAIARLAGERPHGLVIKSELETFYEEEINHGRLYQNLGELVDDGLVRKTPIDGRTNAYQLTETAERRLRAHHRFEAECLRACETQ